MLKPGQTRFILAFMVILFHISQSIFLGRFAVGCFFILSGYWISLMYQNKYSKIKNALKVFYISRFWRLLPVFYAFSILGITTDLIIHHNLLGDYSKLGTLQKGIFLISNMTIFGYGQNKIQILIPAWSLDIEMQFYLLFPLLFYFFRQKKQYLIFMTVLFFLVSSLIFISHQVNLSETVFYYLFLFLIGSGFYFFNIKPGKIIEITALLALLLFFAVHLIVPSLRVSVQNNHGSYYEIVSDIMIFLAIPTLVNSVHHQTNNFDKFLGEMSFMVYLSHWVWIGAYNELILNASKFGRIPYVLGFFIITLLSSYLVYKFIDRPSERLRHNWIKKQPLKIQQEINISQNQEEIIA